MNTHTPAPSGGSTAPIPTRDELINAATMTFDCLNISFGTRKLFRLVDRFKIIAPRAPKFLFFQYLCGAIDMTRQQRLIAMTHPDIARIFDDDPTGEKAVNHVMKQRGY